MPTLVRFLTLVAIFVGAVVAMMAALVHFVEPRQRPVIVDVPLKPFDMPQPSGQRIAPVSGAARP